MRVVSVTLPVSTLDLQQWSLPTLSRQSSGAIRPIAWIRARDPDSRVVVHMSLNDRGHPLRKTAARSRLERVRAADRADVVGAGNETMLLHLTSAGDTGVIPGIGNLRWGAVDHSFWAYAVNASPTPAARS